MRGERESNRCNIGHSDEPGNAHELAPVMECAFVRAGKGKVAYFRRMERKVFNFEESSGAFSGTAVVDIMI